MPQLMLPPCVPSAGEAGAARPIRRVLPSPSHFAVALTFFRAAVIASIALTAAARSTPVAVPDGTSADAVWSSLVQSAAGAVAALSATVPAHLAALQGCTSLADQARDYAAQNPQSAAAPSANELEALLLSRAAKLGDSANGNRLTAVVTAVRTDPRLPVHERFVVSSRPNELAIELTPKLDRAGRLATYEQSARQMLAEFPGAPEPYLSLVAHAEDEPDAVVVAKLAADVLALSAPAEAKTLAAVVAARLALIGRVPDRVLPDPSGGTHTLDRFTDRIVILYSWSVADARSLAMARWLKTQASDRVVRTVRSPHCPSEFVVACALRHCLPEFLAASLQHSSFELFICQRLDLQCLKGTCLAA